MNCKQVKNLIPDWLDSEIEAAGAKTIEDHLFHCESCREEAAFWQAAGAVLREDSGVLKAPGGFAKAVLANLPERQNSGWQGIAIRWRRGMAAAATLLLVSAGAVTGYFQWGVNATPRLVADLDPPSRIITTIPGNNTATEPGVQPNNPVAQPGEDDPAKAGAQPSENNEPKPADPVIKDNNTDEAIDIGEAELMNTGRDRVVERTLVRMKVDDFNEVHARTLEYINGAGAGYEVIASENIKTGSQDSLKIVVDNSRFETLLGNLSGLGQVVTTESSKTSIADEYNKNVEQVWSLKSQFEASSDTTERQQLQVKITGIMSQLKTWDQESKKKTIILLLEN